MNKDLEWFCFHVVTEGLLSQEDCRAVASAMAEARVEADITTFAQTVIDNNLCADVDRLQQFLEMAIQEARTLGFPPRSVFDDDAAAPAAADDQGADEAPQRPGGARRYLRADEEAERDAGSARRQPPAEEEPEDEAEMLRRATSGGRRYVSTETFSEADNAEITGAPEWLYGWPQLAQTAEAGTDGAVALLNDFLHQAREAGCSDVHISAGARPFVRRFKQVHLLPDQAVVTAEVAEAVNLAPLNTDQRQHFDKTRDLDYTYAISQEDRYRTNVMLQRLGVAGAYRIIDTTIRSLGELGFRDPKVIERLTTYHQGLILLTGPSGCGKSTTMSSLVHLINETRHDHIITVEDPIEVVHRPILCNVTQRELHNHTRSFSNALRAALREDPDIIVIGELRDLETIEMAIRSAETGHLVIGTLHTGSAATTMDRILDVFPANQQAQIRAMAAESLRGVICQQLLPNANGDGVVLACEIMLATLAVSNLIREGKTFQLPSTIQTGRNIGMSTMEQSLVDLYMDGKRTYEQTRPLVKSEELIRQMQVQEAARAAAAHGAPKKRKWF